MDDFVTHPAVRHLIVREGNFPCYHACIEGPSGFVFRLDCIVEPTPEAAEETARHYIEKALGEMDHPYYYTDWTFLHPPRARYDS